MVGFWREKGAEQKTADTPPAPPQTSSPPLGVTRRRSQARGAGRGAEPGEEPENGGNFSLVSETNLLGLLRGGMHGDRLRLARSAEALNLSALSLGESDLVSLGELLSLRGLGTPLRRLMLVGCGVTAQGLAHITHSLHLAQELCLSHNSLGDPGAKILCGALTRTDCKVQEMGLCSNSLTDEVVPLLVDSLRVNRSLHVVWLWDNTFNDPQRRSLKQLEADKPWLQIHV